MASKFCPVCGETRSMRVTTSNRRTNERGPIENIRTRAYFCEVCNSFVQREDY